MSGLLALSAALLLQLVQPGRQRLLWGGLLLALWLGVGYCGRCPRPSPAEHRGGPGAGQYPLCPQVGPGDAPASIDRYLALTRAHWGKRLLIWPETAVPDFLHRVLEPLLEPWPRRLAAMGAASVGIPFMNLETRQYYNAAFVVGSEEVHFKRHLVPFGEFLPFKPLLGPLLSFMEIPMSDFSAGALGARPLVRVAGHWVGVSICYEDAFGEEVCGRPCRKRTCS